MSREPQTESEKKLVESVLPEFLMELIGENLKSIIMATGYQAACVVLSDGEVCHCISRGDNEAAKDIVQKIAKGFYSPTMAVGRQIDGKVVLDEPSTGSESGETETENHQGAPGEA